MFIVELLAAGAADAPQNKFGFAEALEQGGFIAYATVVILGIMSFGSFFILFTKWFEQSKLLRQYRELRASFWRAPTLKDGAAKLEKNSAWRQLVDDGLEQVHRVAGRGRRPHHPAQGVGGEQVLGRHRHLFGQFAQCGAGGVQPAGGFGLTS